MKNILFALVMFFAMGGAILASDVDDVNGAVEKLRQAMLSGDKAGLESSILPDLIYVHSGGSVDDARVFVANIANGPDKIDTYTKIDHTNQTVVSNGAQAIVTHIFDGVCLNKGKADPTIIHLGVMQVWRKTDGAWRLSARKAVRLSF